MKRTKPLALFGVVTLAVLVLGALALLVATLLSDVAAVATLALCIVFIVALSVLGAKSKQWRQNPYW
ncbi:hypothetical protein SAMN05421858_1734 [Haladaptatus litoreus]|uniref:Uncharacterized protein n=1 Tax=Haladaptatus litoreus TaxID=553468 RepID=A0A1N6YVA3_9EURY|nr:hypothetical protein [Haladaptatus litoreus]SIR18535.1 hypothetical protein SAMN05421858_1734 [Haladaptatus litoreus]